MHAEFSNQIQSLTTENYNLVTASLLLAIPFVFIWFMVFCLTKRNYSRKKCARNPPIRESTNANRQSFLRRSCSKLCRFLYYSCDLQPLSKDITREPTIPENNVPPRTALSRTEQMFYEKCLTKSVYVNRGTVSRASQLAKEMKYAVPTSPHKTHLGDQTSKFFYTFDDLSNIALNNRIISKPIGHKQEILPRKSHCRVRKNDQLVRKYKRYLMYIRKHSLAGDGNIVSLIGRPKTPSSKNGNCQNDTVEDTNLMFESPWVKFDRAMDEKSRASWRTTSSISSFRTRIAPKISPKASDPFDIIADLYVAPDRLVLDRLIIEGTFGKLYEAKLHIPADRKRFRSERWKMVFVKTVTAEAKNEQIQVLLKDAAKLAGLRHKRLANVLASTQSRSADMSQSECFTNIPLLIYPYAGYGNLKHFLRKTVSGRYDQQSTVALTVDQLVSMGLQIVSAVGYLHEMNIIHGDVATRNCLLDLRFRVFLSDSALSRDLFPEDYHCLGDNTNRPIKWLAMEALVERKFSVATDVWSIGITMWELITKGQQPYDMFDPFEMPNILCAGYRLRQPPNCPDPLWNIIESCWTMPPCLRPSIEKLKQQLEVFKQTVDGFI